MSNKKAPFGHDFVPPPRAGSASAGAGFAALTPQTDAPKEGEGGELPANVVSISTVKRGKEGSASPFTSSETTNAEFLAAIFTDLPEGARPIITAKAGDPETGVWYPHDASQADRVCRSDLNTYFNCASTHPGESGKLTARKEDAAAYHTVVLDDVGTKVDRTLLGNVTPTWALETSPGNFQIGFKLSPPLCDSAEVARLQQLLSAADLTDGGALGMTRWARLPQGINGKPKHAREGKPFACQLHDWNPDVTYRASALFTALGLDKIAPQSGGNVSVRAASRTMPLTGVNREVYLPAADEHPVLSAFKDAGLYKREISPSKHDVTCPWVEEHTDGLDTGAAYFEPSDDYPFGGFVCQHSHKDQYHISEVLEHFQLSRREGRNKPVIRIIPGGIHDQLRAAEVTLSKEGGIYQSSGILVRVWHDDMADDQRIQPLGDAELTVLLSKLCTWERKDASKEWNPCDVPVRVVTTLLKQGKYDFLPSLHGLIRQPCYRKDGTLLTEPGYDAVTKKLAVFNASAFPPLRRTREAAQEALAALRDLLSEFRFAEPVDEAAAVSAMLTGAVRSSLEVAPAYHVKAPAPGSGKSYLCNIIGRFTGDGEPFRMSYPIKNEEATKQVMAALLSAPGAIEFDDMSTDWFPHGSINRMLTSPSITDRILGLSRTATVSTNTLVLGSGNNVGPLRDLCRRVVTINIDAKTATPATIVYTGDPVAKMKANRGKYVMEALTMVEAWRAAGSPRADVPPIGSYGEWADLCRHVLIWLGMPDPAGSLLAQMQNDPDAEQLAAVLSAWHRKHGSKPMTVRRLLEFDSINDPLIEEFQEALHDLPILEGGRFNNHKFGQYLKRNANRIAGDFTLQVAPCSERKAWSVTKVEKGEPSLPLSVPPSADTDNLF